MSEAKTLARGNIVPALLYRDAAAAIDWLERALGFRRRLVVPGPDGAVKHAELTHGPDVLMIGSSRPDQGWYSPLELKGATATVCLVVEDPDAAYARATAAGMEITFELKDQEYGSREFTGRDPEGHTWTVGTYRAGAYWDQ